MSSYLTHYIALRIFDTDDPGALQSNITATLDVNASLSVLTPLPTADALWPIGLPQSFLVDGYQETPGESWIRTPMEVGAGKVRRRYTAMPRTITGTVIVTRSQVENLRTFVRLTLDGGTRSFLWKDPRSGVPRLLRFTKMPSFEPAVPDLWLAKLELETVL